MYLTMLVFRGILEPSLAVLMRLVDLLGQDHCQHWRLETQDLTLAGCLSNVNGLGPVFNETR